MCVCGGVIIYVATTRAATRGRKRRGEGLARRVSGVVVSFIGRIVVRRREQLLSRVIVRARRTTHVPRKNRYQYGWLRQSPSLVVGTVPGEPGLSKNLLGPSFLKSCLTLFLVFLSIFGILLIPFVIVLKYKPVPPTMIGIFFSFWHLSIFFFTSFNQSPAEKYLFTDRKPYM